MNKRNLKTFAYLLVFLLVMEILEALVRSLINGIPFTLDLSWQKVVVRIIVALIGAPLINRQMKSGEKAGD